LGEEIQAIIDAGADMLHVDVMDHHYVPNLTFGPLLCQAIHQRFPTLPLDVHLMASPIDALIQQFAEAGATRISIHPDTTLHLDRSLQLIKEQGCAAGLVLNPAISLDCLEWCTHQLDFVLAMTVNPGFGGQTLIPSVVKKIKKIHQLYPDLALCVDGGIKMDNIADLAKAGASEFVIGSAIFQSQNYSTTIAQMREQLRSE
jgi:ribulose-phosphate 3-epimerase